MTAHTREHARFIEADRSGAPWRAWGPFLADRAWGEMRENFGSTQSQWEGFPHDHARSRAYRWGEDGLGGFCDSSQNICLAVALWNERDPFLKERLFGVSNEDGNHGQDVKEYYYYLDGLPSYAYVKMLYKYPQVEYPYDELVRVSRLRGVDEGEYELLDALADDFAAGRYFDVYIEYAKAAPLDILCRITAHNRGPQPAPLHILPHLWFRNTWAWDEDSGHQPQLRADGDAAVRARHAAHGEWRWVVDGGGRPVDLFFTDNETNRQRLYGEPNRTPYVKDGIHEAVVNGRAGAVNPGRVGAKAAARVRAAVPPGGQMTVRLRFSPDLPAAPFAGFEECFAQRRAEADEYYASLYSPESTAEERMIQRQAAAGLVWVEQFYHYDVARWAQEGEDAQKEQKEQPQAEQGQESNGKQQQGQQQQNEEQDSEEESGQEESGQEESGKDKAAESAGRAEGADRRETQIEQPDPSERVKPNAGWMHFRAASVLSMPDKWEFPWFAAWDLAFQVLPLGRLDPASAKRQLRQLLRPGYLHPNGQIPAYEATLGDANPPNHAWSAWRIYELEREQFGEADRAFLAAVFRPLLQNYTWWVNEKATRGYTIFGGGFLGMDNISIVNRSEPPPGSRLDQADGTGWMALYAVSMLRIALELAQDDPSFEDQAVFFLEQYAAIAGGLYAANANGQSLWNEEKGFFFDIYYPATGSPRPLEIFSYVGLIPLFATMILDAELLEAAPTLRRRLQELAGRPGHDTPVFVHALGDGAARGYHLAAVDPPRLERILKRVCSPGEFLSDYGIRSLSKLHAAHPVEMEAGGERLTIGYEPAESQSEMMGGNSNWRGPLWAPIHYMLSETLRTYRRGCGAQMRVHVPGASKPELGLGELAREVCRRTVSIFCRSESGRRPVFGGYDLMNEDPHWRDHLLFHEYFHADTGAGLGAGHQSGWTSLIFLLIDCPVE